MQTRTKKVQAKYSITGSIGFKKTRIIPSLELSGDWFSAAGFAPGQLATIEVINGQITIKPAV
ncbi:type I addiction module toxin, SymE family (plasmid) [Spirosoma taeanense]|uniref:Type I addiction module toxin, SymE family n=1 Tax=Spirosoma taeanense TaxID=2735870 RepID=A0A6M5YER3_9BACT|nr:SymE family type I addiction module toxin [Spirosoma taeanense]QJW92497.1 type I addiction module toxin, SymE family [Spirosoma taeanense]